MWPLVTRFQIGFLCNILYFHSDPIVSSFSVWLNPVAGCKIGLDRSEQGIVSSLIAKAISIILHLLSSGTADAVS
jgi:hypothetical protein